MGTPLATTRAADDFHDLGRISIAGFAAVDDFTALEHIQAVGVFGNVVDVRFGDQDPVSEAADRGDAFADIRDDRRRQALERLIEQEQLRVEGQRARNRDHLAFTARELVAAARGVIAQFREDLVGERDARFRIAALGTGPGRQFDVLGDVEIAEDLALLGRVANAELGRCGVSASRRFPCPGNRSCPRPVARNP
jgi:hypothetical protein